MNLPQPAPAAPVRRHPRDETLGFARGLVAPVVSHAGWWWEEGGQADGVGDGVGEGDGVGTGAKTPGHSATASG